MTVVPFDETRDATLNHFQLIAFLGRVWVPSTCYEMKVWPYKSSVSERFGFSRTVVNVSSNEVGVLAALAQIP